MKRKSVLALVLSAVMFISTLGTNTQMVAASEILNQANDSTASSSQVEWKGALTDEEKEKLSNRLISAEQLSVLNLFGIRTDEYAIPASNASTGSTVVANGLHISEIDSSRFNLNLLNNSSVNSFKILNEKNVKAEDMVRVIIFMNDKAVLEKDSTAELDETTQKEIEKLEDKQETVIERIEDTVFDGEELDITYSYTWVANGVATEVPYGMIDEIKAVKGVKEVVVQTQYETPSATNDTYSTSDSVMIGRDDSWAAGYTGKGMKIAVIDTGLDDDHPNFAAMEEDSLTADSATRESIAEVLESGALKAQGLKTTLTADKVDKVYRSNKVPFAFNYVDRSYRVNHADNQGDHGTHVAGISAANDLRSSIEDSSVGVAPDAQIYVMKVFGTNAGAYTEDIVAAVEDAMLLGADVINMSLGSPCGFSENGTINAIYNTISAHNTVCVVAAGNSTTAGLGNLWGTDTNLASNPDNSVVSSPATYVNVTSVASVDNVGSMGYYLEVNGQKIAYSDGSNGPNEKMLNVLGGQSVEYAMVGNCGQTLEDFESANVAGKVAVVKRGVTAFTAKCALAEQAGAIACLIYNNTSGAIGLDLSNGTATIPCASIRMQAGEYLATQLAQDPEAVMTFSDSQAVIPSETAYRMSDFTSWGVSPDLKLEPDLTGPGGNIYSTIDDGKYGLMSGTSMASPNVAGVTALIMQYAKTNYPSLTNTDLRNFVNQLLVSTAVPLDYDETVKFSPRVQGAGLANAYNAIKSDAYLSVTGADVPKAELGDDVSRTGVYNYTFTVHNFGDHDLYYSLETTCQTEDVLKEDGNKFMATTPIILGANTSESSTAAFMPFDFNEDGVVDTADATKLAGMEVAELDTDLYFIYDVNDDDVVDDEDVQAMVDAITGANDEIDLTQKLIKVEAESDVDVTVNVKVNNTGKRYMDKNFENGIYVEGYTLLTAENPDGIDLSLPYLAFYGDWTEAPILDAGYYWENEEDSQASQYWNVLFTNFANDSWLPGVNPYLDEEFNADYISISPNGDGYGDFINDIYLALLRNANTLSFTYKDATTGTVYDEQTIDKIAKSYMVSSYNMIVPFVYSGYTTDGDLKGYYFKDAEGNTLANNTKVDLIIKAELDYDAHASANDSDTWTTHFTVDTEKPTIVSADVVKENGKVYLDVTFKDNVAVAAMNFLNRTGSVILDQCAVEKPENLGDAVTQRFDVTGFGNDFVMVPGDYAFNETYYEVVTTDNDPYVNENLLYGYRVYDNSGENYYGWVGVDPETAEVVTVSPEGYINPITSACSVGENIIAIDTAYNLVAIKPGYWDDRTFISNLEANFAGLVFDSVSETLYGYDKKHRRLCKIDITTGEVTTISKENIYLIAMAMDNRGVLYAIDSQGILKTLNTKTGAWGYTIADLTEKVNFSTYYSQSMTYDTERKCLCWSTVNYDYSTYTAEGILYEINLNTAASKSTLASITEVGHLDNEAELVAFTKLSANDYELPNTEVSEIELDRDSVKMLVDDEDQLYVSQYPWYGNTPGYTWTSSDPAVATVDADGVITALTTGTTTITATSTVDATVKASCEVEVIAPSSTLGAFANIGNTVKYQWVDFSVDDFENATANTTEESPVVFTAGEYYDGYIYAYTQGTELYKVNASTFAMEKLSGRHSDGMMLDMAFNYADGYMYGIFQSSADGTANLVRVDLMNGSYETVYEYLMDEDYNNAITLAISTTGTIYVGIESGDIYTLVLGDDENEPVFDLLGATGYTASSYSQSMTYDHNDNALYWSIITATGASAVSYVDTATGAIVPLGVVDKGVQLTCLYSVPSSPISVPSVEVESVSLDNSIAGNGTLLALKGSRTNISVNVLPFNATDRAVTWESSDPSVATIDGNFINAVAEGTATITGTKTTGLAEDSYVDELVFTVKVIPAAGTMTGYILADFYSGGGSFWGEFADNDINSGDAIASSSGYDLYAGTYYDGLLYTYGVDATNEDEYVYQYMVIDPDEEYTVTKLNVLTNAPDMRDLSYDYTAGAMYGVGGVRNVSGATSLYAIDMENGASYLVGKIRANGNDVEIVSMTFTADGKLYGVNTNGAVYEINKTNGEASFIFSTELTANTFQSMHYDYNSGNIYWAQAYADTFNGVISASLYIIDVEEQAIVNIGCVGNAGCAITALYTVPNEQISETVAETSDVLISAKSKVLKLGDSFELNGKPYPLCRESNVVVSYSSSNTAVATVSSNGMVTAKKAGAAVITVTAGSATKTCKIRVVDDSLEIYAVNSTGIESAAVYNPGEIKGTSVISGDEDFAVYTSAYDGKENVFYAYDEAGALWKFNRDGSKLTQITETNYLELIDNADEFWADAWWPAQLLDLAYNPYNEKLYAVIDGTDAIGFPTIWGEEDHYPLDVIYEVNKTTGALTKVGVVPTGDGEISRADKLAFYSENELFIYCGYDDYVYDFNLTTGEFSGVVWTQQLLASGDYVGFAYCEETELIYLATNDMYSGGMAFFQIDPSIGTIEKIGDAAYDENLKDLAFLPGKPSGTVSDSKSNAKYTITYDKYGKPLATFAGLINKSVTSVTIPDVVNINGFECKVVAIADNALKSNTKVAKVTIGKNVTKIGTTAFYGCTALATVTLGANVTTIGASAFQNCAKLAKITIGSKVTAIADKTFSGCSSLATVTLGSNVTKIGASAFYKCTKLAKITVGNKVTSIGTSAFYGCTVLKTVTIGSALKTLGANVFYGCKAMTTLKITSTKLAASGINAKAFAGISTKTVVKVPSAKVSAYKSLFQKKGLDKKVKVVKY